MYKVNDFVVYNSSGVYKIKDIKKEKDISNNEIEYYVLQPAFAQDSLTIKTPVTNSRVRIRKVINKEDVLSIIASMPEMKTIWIDDFKERNEIFKQALRSGDVEKWVRLVKSIYKEKQDKNEIGKKIRKTDEDIMKAAEKNINEEFALALNISPDEVGPYIIEHIS